MCIRDRVDDALISEELFLLFLRFKARTASKKRCPDGGLSEHERGVRLSIQKPAVWYACTALLATIIWEMGTTYSEDKRLYEKLDRELERGTEKGDQLASELQDLLDEVQPLEGELARHFQEACCSMQDAILDPLPAGSILGIRSVLAAGKFCLDM